MATITAGVFVERALAWVRSAYPDGVPAADRDGLIQVLGERLTRDELDLVMSALPGLRGSTDSDGAAITVLGDGSTENVAVIDRYRVAGRLATGGWPLADVAA